MVREIIGRVNYMPSLFDAFSVGKRYPQTVVVMTINAPIDTVFHYIAPINLMHIFRGSALIPAVVDTSIKEG